MSYWATHPQTKAYFVYCDNVHQPVDSQVMQHKKCGQKKKFTNYWSTVIELDIFFALSMREIYPSAFKLVMSYMCIHPSMSWTNIDYSLMAIRDLMVQIDWTDLFEKKLT